MANVPFTEIVAWYGATVATVVLVWDIWKWSRRQARLRVQITDRVFYPDDPGPVLKTEKTANGEIKTYAGYYHVEVTNIGELPTTILSASATTRAAGVLDHLQAWRHSVVGEFGTHAFMPHRQETPPHTLGPGEVWSCRVQEDSIHHLCQRGRRPKLELTASCWSRPRLFEFPLPRPVDAGDTGLNKP